MEQQSFCRIVLIDDSRMVRLGIREQLLTATDLRVVGEAMSGAEGMELVKQVKPDLVLLDLMLPGMNGIDVCRVLRADSGVQPASRARSAP